MYLYIKENCEYLKKDKRKINEKIKFTLYLPKSDRNYFTIPILLLIFDSYFLIHHDIEFLKYFIRRMRNGNKINGFHFGLLIFSVSVSV